MSNLYTYYIAFADQPWRSPVKVQTTQRKETSGDRLTMPDGETVVEVLNVYHGKGGTQLEVCEV